MSDEIHSFISDLLHRRGLVDHDGFALQTAAALVKVRTWDRVAVRKAIDRIHSDIYRRDSAWPKAKVLDLVTSRVLKKWPTGPNGEETNDMRSRMIKVLFVAANPVNIVAYHPVNNTPLTNKPLGLDQEFREIKTKLRSSKHRESFQLISCPAAQPDDLLDAFNEERPQIVHFSGHGTDTDALVMLDSQGNAKLVSKKAIESLFKVMRDNIRVVVLNACFSKVQATAITKHIDCAIGMNKEIGDKAAIRFAASFYRALAYGASVKAAFDQSVVSLQLEGINEDRTPKLMSRVGVNPNKVVLV